MDEHGFLHPVSSLSVPSFSNCVARSKVRFSSSNRSMVKSPFVTVPASDGRPASVMNASYDYVESFLARLPMRQRPAGCKTHLIVAICLQKACHQSRSRVFDGHVCLSEAGSLRISATQCISLSQQSTRGNHMRLSQVERTATATPHSISPTSASSPHYPPRLDDAAQPSENNNKTQLFHPPASPYICLTNIAQNGCRHRILRSPGRCP